MHKDSSLVLVGSGIKFLSHLTTEAKSYILQSDKTLYLVNEPAMKTWIQQNAKSAESLDLIYFKHAELIDSYHAITHHILQILHSKIHLCVVLYGHPTVFSSPGLAAIKEAKRQGLYTKVLPGISAQDCLFADLLINPANNGCLSYEATDLILAKRIIDARSHIIIWQIGNLGIVDHKNINAANHDHIELFLEYLYNFYKPEQEVYLYEAAQYPHLDPSIHKTVLKSIIHSKLTKLTTIYIPPTKKSEYCPQTLKKLNLTNYLKQ